LSIGADGHLGLVDLAVARIENVAVLIFQTVALHITDEGQSEQRRVLAVVGAFAADLVRNFTRPWKCLGDRALEDSVVIDDEEPHHHLAVLDLLPEPSGSSFGGLRRWRGREQQDHAGRHQKCESKSGEGIPHHRHHLTNR
jgi:hypothetical protein